MTQFHLWGVLKKLETNVEDEVDVDQDGWLECFISVEEWTHPLMYCFKDLFRTSRCDATWLFRFQRWGPLCSFFVENQYPDEAKREEIANACNSVIQKPGRVQYRGMWIYSHEWWVGYDCLCDYIVYSVFVYLNKIFDNTIKPFVSYLGNLSKIFYIFKMLQFVIWHKINVVSNKLTELLSV